MLISWENCTSYWKVKKILHLSNFKKDMEGGITEVHKIFNRVDNINACCYFWYRLDDRSGGRSGGSKKTNSEEIDGKSFVTQKNNKCLQWPTGQGCWGKDSGFVQVAIRCYPGGKTVLQERSINVLNGFSRSQHCLCSFRTLKGLQSQQNMWAQKLGPAVCPGKLGQEK